MATSQNQLTIPEILEQESRIPAEILSYFRERFRNHVYDVVLREFIKCRASQRLGKTELARRIGRSPELIIRWLGTPGNWTLDTISDLLLAMGAEPKVAVTPIDNRRFAQRKEFGLPRQFTCIPRGYALGRQIPHDWQQLSPPHPSALPFDMPYRSQETGYQGGWIN